MAGFGSRLRKEFESTRAQSSSSHHSGNLHASSLSKNIRGLTRLGGSAGAIGGGVVLRGRNATSATGVPLPVQTPSLRMENGGQDVTTSLVNRPSSAAGGGDGVGVAGGSGGGSTSDGMANVMSSTSYVNVGSVASGLEGMLSGGKSKIVPGWGAPSKNNNANSTEQSSSSGGKMTSKDPTPMEVQQRERELEALGKQQQQQSQQQQDQQQQQQQPSGKYVPWALIPPTRTDPAPPSTNASNPSSNPTQDPSTMTRSSAGRARRWGDEEDEDSDDERPPRPPSQQRAGNNCPRSQGP